MCSCISKKTKRRVIICVVSILCFAAVNSYGQNVGIGTTAPHASSKLDIQSTNQGLLVPRMSTAQRTSIVSPAIGLFVFDTDTNSFWFYGGAAWINLVTNSSGWLLDGNTGINPSLNFIGTTDNQPLIFKVNNEKVGLLEPSNGYANGNVAWGPRSMANNTTGHLNVAIGRDALGALNTGRTFLIAIGDSTLFNNQASDNTAIGNKALLKNTTGIQNIAIGNVALGSNITGNQNIAIGGGSLYNNTTGPANTAIGYVALRDNTTGSSNTALGYSALLTSTGSFNVGIGRNTLSNNTGDYNTAVGMNSLTGNVTGTQNTAIGYLANVSADNLTNTTAIGYFAMVNASNKVRIGNGAVTVIEGAVPFTTTSDGRFKYNIQEDVRGLAFIMKLRPITYQFDVKRFEEQLGGGNVSQVNYSEASLMRRSGFIAQEVEKAALETGYDFNGIIKPKSGKDHYGLSYESFVVPLVKAMQEQQQLIDAQKQELKNVKAEVEELKKTVNRLLKISN
jgi:hypothetical protein